MVFGGRIAIAVPQWVLDAIGDYQTQHATYEAHRLSLERAAQALRISAGDPSKLVYEIWTDRNQRLDGQYDFRAQAEAALSGWLERYPDAKVTRVHRRAPMFGGTVELALLDTLIGRVFWAGCTFASGDRTEEVHAVQDETGRCVSAPTSALMAHECMNRMTQEARGRIEFSATEEKRKAARRAPSASEGGV